MGVQSNHISSSERLNMKDRSEYKIKPRTEVEKLVTDFIVKNKIYAEYGKDTEGLFVVNFVVEEHHDK